MTLDDKLLVELARQGSSEAIGEIYERYWPVVWMAAFAITDVVRSRTTRRPRRCTARSAHRDGRDRPDREPQRAASARR